VEVVPAWIGRMNDDRRLAVVLGVGFILAGPLAGGALAGLRPSDIATGVVCIAGQCLAVAWRRRRPLVALTACCAAVLTPAALVPAVDVGTVTEAAQTVLAALVLYSLLVHGSVRQATVAMACIASLFVIDVVAALPDRSPATMTAVSSTALEAFVLVAFVLVVVLVARARRLDAALLVEQVRHDAALREQGARMAAASERLRIARELHDCVANRLSAASVYLTGLRRADQGARGGTEHGRALEVVAEELGGALDDLRSMLTTLRDRPDTSDWAPASLSELSDLVADARRQGTEVSVAVTGSVRPVDRAVDLAACRILRESLANVVRHGHGGNARVTVHYGRCDLDLRVDDDGGDGDGDGGQEGGPAHPVRPGGGYGVLGMRERAALCGGWLHAGPRAGGGWQVVASLPLGTSPDGVRRP
jgi:signal transduction histidine kinase